MHTCSCRSCGLSVVDIWNHAGKSIAWYLVFFESLFFSIGAFLILFFSLFTFTTVQREPACRCVGAHGWVAVIASHRSVLLSRGWLITVEAPGHPGHPPSTNLNAAVRLSYALFTPKLR